MDIITPSRPRSDSLGQQGGHQHGRHSRAPSEVSSIPLHDVMPEKQQQEEQDDNEQELPQYEDSWEPEVAVSIAEKIKVLREEQKQTRPYMVALVGTPGSGKSVSSFLLADKLEGMGYPCMIMPHDGYHYPLHSLKLFPDAEDAVYRRGAPDTFDPAALLRDLHRIRDGQEEWITVPAFDHAKGDPEPDRHAFDRHQHKVVLCEGLYLLHDKDGWEDIADIFDWKICLNSDIDACVERVKIRNRCIPGYTPEEIDLRCEVVDRTNAITVLKSRVRADQTVDSLAMKQQKEQQGHEPQEDHPPVTVPPRVVSTPNLHHLAPHMVEEEQENTMKRALTLLSLKDVDMIETAEPAGVTADWALDITSRTALVRKDSIWSQSEATETNASEIVQQPPHPDPVAAHIGSWELNAAQQILQCVNEGNKCERPYMVALVGIPGSGKTASAFLLANHLEQKGFPCMILPHDGYHYPLDHLKTFPDADAAIYRRGAPDTFDPFALHRDLMRIRDGTEELIMLPAFDHSRADPEPDTHAFDRHRHKIVLVEGLWLLHQEDGWEDVSKSFDFSIFMNSDIDVCIDRVKVRNQCIPGYTVEQITKRCDEVDRKNAETVMKTKGRATMVVDGSGMTKS